MAWITEEEYQAAKQVRAYEYLKKTRTRNEWQLQDHDSFKINEITSKWHWKSRDIGGMSALRFLMQVDGMEYTQAVKTLCEQTPVYIPREEPAPKKKEFVLPVPNDSFYRVRRYWITVCRLESFMRVILIIMRFLLDWMSRNMQSMRFCVGFMTAGERVLKWNRKEATNSIAFVFRL